MRQSPIKRITTITRSFELKKTHLGDKVDQSSSQIRRYDISTQILPETHSKISLYHTHWLKGLNILISKHDQEFPDITYTG